MPNDNTNAVDIDPALVFELTLLGAFHNAPEHIKAEICVLLHLEATQYTRQASSVEGERITSGTGKVLLNTGNKGKPAFEQDSQPAKLTYAAETDSDPELRPVDEEEEVKKGKKEEGQDAAAGSGIPSVRESRVARYRRNRPADFCPAYFLTPDSEDDEEDNTQGVRSE